MIRKIIKIDAHLCNGCGACAAACHEGAIAMVDGKAKLMREDFCDGLGDCLPACPTGAIRFVEREAKAYDAQAVSAGRAVHTCPGSRARALQPHPADTPVPADGGSCLAQWPCQIRLVPLNAPYFQDSALLIAADCTAYAYALLHENFMRGRVTLIGCPKLDPVDYSEKLAAILQGNDVRSVTVLRMEVPCCGGLERAVRAALSGSGKEIPCRVVTIGVEGTVLEDTGR